MFARLKISTVINILVFNCTLVFSQSEIIGDEAKPAIKLHPNAFKAVVVNGDTMASVLLPPVLIVDKHIFKSKQQEKRYWRLVYNVKKVLPYARMAGQKYKTLNEQLVNKSEGEKKFLMKRVENEIKREFGKDIENMTYTQGRILLKLIDRETGVTAYDLVKELRGTFPAFFWQSVSLMFDNNLKSEYDPQGDEKEIESIVLLVDRGML